MKFGPPTNLNIQNSMVKLDKFSPRAWNWEEVWFLDQLKYAELDGDIQFFCFKLEAAIFGADLVQIFKTWYLDHCEYLKFEGNGFAFSVLDQKYLFFGQT